MDSKAGQADLFKQRGIDLVTDNNLGWMARAMLVIESLPSGSRYTGEDVRHVVEDAIGPPGHHNAYGALVSHAVRKRLLAPTGDWQKMKDPQSHARQTPVYWCQGQVL